MKYHIKITNNETGEVIEDADFCCIIGAFGTKESAKEIAAYDCPVFAIVGTAQAALSSVENACTSSPEIALLANIVLKKGGMLKNE